MNLTERPLQARHPEFPQSLRRHPIRLARSLAAASTCPAGPRPRSHPTRRQERPTDQKEFIFSRRTAVDFEPLSTWDDTRPHVVSASSVAGEAR
jgi:hypothetical protein